MFKGSAKLHCKNIYVEYFGQACVSVCLHARGVVNHQHITFTEKNEALAHPAFE